MNWRRHFIEAATLIGAAVLCALVANAMAGRDRKVAIVGNYPNATKVPVTVMAPPPPVVTPTTTTIAPPPPEPVPTTTTAKPSHPATQQPQKPAAAVVVQAEQFPPHPDKPYIEITYDAVKQLHDKGALFLDARRTSVYEQGHIAGARPFSVWEADIDEKVNKLFEERGDPRQQAEPIVVYCSGGDCEDSHMLAQKLWGIQYNNVYVYKDGFPDWEKHGAPAHTGATP
jgi:rhodanese-related sulfurtransferase